MTTTMRITRTVEQGEYGPEIYYQVWERTEDPSAYSDVAKMPDGWFGRIGTRIGLPAPSDCRDYYRQIIQMYPEAALGRRDGTRIVMVPSGTA